VHDDIEDVIVRFASGCDEAEWDAVDELLTDDVTLEVIGQGVVAGPGRDEVLAHAKKTAAARASRGERGRHLVTNIRVDIATDGTANARSYVTFIVTTTDGTASILAFACYDDRLAQVDGKWRLAARTITFDRDKLPALTAR
jgi:3-phenylpropionate/cinnamic acid dioxygenase small subunit